MIIEFHDHHGKLKTEINMLEDLVSRLIEGEKLSVKELNIILVTDDFLKKMHDQYLNDDTETDVITFDLTEEQSIEAEIYISYDRAIAHTGIFNVDLEDELARLVVHGMLHLMGFYDYTDDERKVMRQKEDEMIANYWN